MAEKIFIADKKTLDEVNKKLDSFSSGTDWSKYNIIAENNRKKVNYGQETLIQEIQGCGFISECYIHGNIQIRIKIIIDDVIALETPEELMGHISESSGLGFKNINNNDIFITNNPGSPFGTAIMNTSIKDKEGILMTPIFFKKKIQVFATVKSDSIYFRFYGGVKA